MNAAIPWAYLIPLYIELIDLITRRQLFLQVLNGNLPIAPWTAFTPCKQVQPLMTVSLDAQIAKI